MRIVCARSVAFGAEAFGTLGEVTVLPDDRITADALNDADAAITRSKTKITPDLVNGSRLRFVGTATAGADHLAIPALESAGIAWARAPGCNAESVAEYVVCALLWLRRLRGVQLSGRRIGIVGVGQVGGRVVRAARALGMTPLVCDPPRREAEPDAMAWMSLEALLPQCDLVTLHTPLIDGGPCPTRGMADADFFDRLPKGAVFINTSRGEVADEPVLKAVLASGYLSHAVLDVWAREPDIDAALMDAIDLATPHIAGYSLDGRVRGTEMIYAACCKALNLKPRWTPPELPNTPEPITLDPDDYDALESGVRTVYDIERDDQALRDRPATVSMADHFNALRKHYPVRREFAAF